MSTHLDRQGDGARVQHCGVRARGLRAHRRDRECGDGPALWVGAIRLSILAGAVCRKVPNRDRPCYLILSSQ